MSWRCSVTSSMSRMIVGLGSGGTAYAAGADPNVARVKVVEILAPIYQAMQDKFQAMWVDQVGFTTFSPQPPDAAVQSTPTSGMVGVSTIPALVWNRAPFATSYDVYLGTTQSNMALAANVPGDAVIDIVSEAELGRAPVPPPAAAPAGS